MYKILDLSNSGEDLRSEVMGLKKTDESVSASFTDFMHNSTSQVDLGLSLEPTCRKSKSGTNSVSWSFGVTSQEQVLSPRLLDDC